MVSFYNFYSLVKKKPFLVLFSLFSFIHSFGQPVLDQQHTNGTSNNYVGATCGIQTFQPGITGPYASVDLQLNSAGVNNATLELVSGLPQGGTILGTVTVAVPNGTNWVNFRFPSCGPNLTSGTSYYFRLSGVVNWLYSTSGSYPSGWMYQCSGSSYPSFDLNFRTYMYNGGCTAPTPGSNQTSVMPGTPSSPLGVNVFGLTGTWTSSGTGTFSNQLDPNSTYTPSCGDAGNLVTLTWTSCCNITQTCSQTISVSPNVMTVNNAIICAGGTATLSATGATSYTWSANAGGATTASVNLTPSTTTNYTVSGSFPNSCIVNQVSTITVNPLPSMTSGNAVTICSGQTLNLNFTSNQSPVTYQWIAGSNVNVSGQSTTNQSSSTLNNTLLNLTGTAQTVSYTVTPKNTSTNCIGINQIVNITVNPLPVVTVSATSNPICNGGITTLTAGGANSYSWAPGTSLSSTSGVTVSANPLTTTTYTILGTNTLTACSNNSILTVTVNPLPSASAGLDQAACSGTIVPFTITPSGGTPGYIYEWYNVPIGGTPISTSQTYNISQLPGTYNFYGVVKDANNCASARDIVQLTSYAIPNIDSVTSIDVNCFGDATGTLNGFASGGTAPYKYTFDGAAPFYTNPITGLSAGSYTLFARDANGCISSNSQSATINEPSAITLGTSGNSAPCSNTPLSVLLTGSGGAGGYSYSWIAAADYNNTTGENFSSNTNTNTINDNIVNTITTAEVVNYSVTITDANSCSANFNVLTTIAPVPTLLAISNQVLCAGASSAAIVFTSSINGSTISWTNSTPSIGIAGSGTTNIAATPMVNVGTTPVVANFNATANFSGCTGPAQTFNITVNPSPVVTSANSASICEGVALNLPLTANIGGTTFTWVASNNPNTNGESTGPVSTSTINNTITSTSTVNELVVYNVTPTSSGCFGAVQTVNVTVKPQPNLSVISNQTLCAGSLSSAVNFVSDVVGSTFSWTNSNTGIGIGASGISNIPATTLTNAGASAISGNFSAQATANGCISSPQTFLITVNPIPTTPIPTALNACLGSLTNFTTSFVSGGTYNWNFGDGNTSTLQNPTHTYAAAGVYTASVTATAATCVSAVGTVNATVHPTSVGGTITGGTSPACNGSNSGTLTLSGNTGTVNGWEFSINGGGSWSPIANTTTSQVYSNLTVTIMYRAIVQSGVCASVNSAIKTIVVNDPPSASSAGLDQNLCNITISTLGGNTPGVGTGNWSVISGTAVVTTPTSPTSGVTGLTIGGSSVLRWTIANSPCASTTDDVTITSNPNPSILGTLSACVGATSSLSGTGTPNGATPWTSSFPSSATINSSGLVTASIGGTTNITYMDINGCSTMSTFTVNTLPTASITAGGPLTFCSGNTVTFTASPNTGVNYQWKHGATNVGTNSSTYTTGNAGNHTVIVSDLITGCIDTSNMLNVNVDANPIITSVTPSLSSICNSSSTLITLSQSGGNSYTWSPSVSLDNSNIQNPTASPTSTTIYTVVVTNTLTSCNSSSTTVVNVTNAPTVSATVTDVTCFGASTGAIAINAAGGTPSYNYSIDNISFIATNSFTNLSAGSYTLYVKDANNCTGQTNVSVSQPASGLLVASSGLTNICSGQAWGETFSSSGGFGSITYSWASQPPTNVTGASSGSGNAIGEILTATTTNPYIPETVIYDLFATDQNGCNATSTFTVYVNPLPTVSVSSDANPICISSVANLAATHSSDFFGWNPTTGLTVFNADTALFTPSAAGTFVITYTVAMNTGANCTNTGSLTLTVTPGPTAPILSYNSPVCAGSSINLTSNTIATASYSWSGPNGFTSPLEDPTIIIATPADAGTYTCTINVGGCTSSSTINVGVNPKPQAIVLGVSTTFCANETFTLDGSTSLPNSTSITNYQWQLGGSNVGTNSPTYAGNTPGNYSLIVTNDLGCTDTTLTPNIVSADPAPTSIITGTTTFCSGANTTLDGSSSTAGGSATITNYEWLFNGTSISSNSTFIASTGGNYQLTTTNSNSCTNTSVITVVNEIAPPAPPAFVSTASTFCAGDSVLLSISSVNGSSIYSWSVIPSGGFNSFPTWADAYFSATTSGTYTLSATETDINGCISAPFNITLAVNSAPIATASFTSNDTICYNGNVSVTLNTIAGASYSWNNSLGQTSNLQSPSFNNITTSGTIQFYGKVTDAAGCASLNDTINLVVSNQLMTPTIVNASSVCPGQSFTLNSNLLVSGADYYWTDPSSATQNGVNLTSITIPVANAVTAGPYVVYYIDQQGCVSPTSPLYNQPLEPTPIVSISGVSTICSGNSTLLSASTSVGIASAYQWYNNGAVIAGATSASYNASTPGNYNVEIILSSGCIDTAVVATTVNVSTGPTVIVNPTSSSVCAGNSATISASGAVTYSWDTGATTPSITVNPTATTSYIVTGTDAGGCTNTDTAVVIVNALPATPTITAGSTIECAGTNVSLNSNSTLTNTWINTSTLAVIGTTQNISLTETVAGVYNYGVYVTDANSCNSATATIAVTFNSCLTNLISDNTSTNTNVPVSGNFLTNDGSPSIFTTVSIVNGPANGVISVSSNGNYTYTPNTNFSGYNMVIVQVCDATPTCLNDTIYIVVNPNIVGDTYTVNGLSTPNSIIGNVLLNDAGTGITGNVTLVNSVSNGIIVIDTLGNFNYTPSAGFCGTDIFTYNVCDQNGLCANAGVNLIVTCDSSIVTNTGFSPNGDGVNDNWVIQGIETTQNTVTVFDRWGNQVISITNYNNGNASWDGKNSNGVELPAGTYFYSIDVVNEKSKKGWVEITK